MKNFSIAVHGGAGTILKSKMTPEREKAYKAGLKTAIDAGYQALEKGESALRAVELAVIELENSPLFNAGRGSVYTNKGTQETEASIMDGKARRAGATTLLKGVKNPISLARLVMEKTDHVLLGGDSALEFAKKQGCVIEDESYFHDDYRYQQWLKVKGTGNMVMDHSDKEEKKNSKIGTVGAVALDDKGNIAAATSTGGMTNKMSGRIGDTPLIGAGTYADNRTCAVSCTGQGEFFIKSVVAYDVSCLIRYKGLSLQDACRSAIQNLGELGGEGGLIAVDTTGNIVIELNTEGMYRAYRKSDGSKDIAIYK